MTVALYLGYESAVAYWLCKPGFELVPSVAEVRTLGAADISKAAVRSARLPLEWSESKPLHVIVPDRALIRRRPDIACHVWSRPIPKGAFHELLDASYISSPEFTFLQMAARLTLVEEVELGCYLCGSFAIGSEGRGFAGGREPLTSVREIEGFLERAEGSYGVAKARRALRYVLDGAASPMEVMLAMTMSLPPKEGGWGFPAIELNQKIPIADELQGLAGASFYVGDIYISDVKGDVEYDSNEFHTGAYRLDHTQERRNVLETMGVKTMSATWGQVRTYEKFKSFIWAIKKRFGIRVRACTSATELARERLYDYLTDMRRTMF